jgi:hypothetical protein
MNAATSVPEGGRRKKTRIYTSVVAHNKQDIT